MFSSAQWHSLAYRPLRDIPFYCRLIDRSFGVVGVIPLWLADRLIARLGTAHDQAPTGLFNKTS